MNMQQMIAQAQRMQREIQKAKNAFYEQEFNESRSGLVSVSMLGNKKVTSIEIKEDGFEKENKEMIEELIQACINTLVEKIDNEEAKIEEAITGKAGGIGF